jgi:dTDP-glucose pyrophosphorylase
LDLLCFLFYERYTLAAVRTRLHPIPWDKRCHRLFDKPMIYYPLSKSLTFAGDGQEILIITTLEDRGCLKSISQRWQPMGM